MLNRSHGRPSPCLNPFVVMKGSDFSPSTLTSDKVSLHVLTSYAGIPNAYIAERFCSPFLKIGHITLIFHSGGSSSSDQTFCKTICRCSGSTSPPVFRYSAGIPSDPGLLLFLSRLIARVTSWYLRWIVIPSAASPLAVEWNTGRLGEISMFPLSRSLKYSTQRFVTSAGFVIRVPYLL